MKLIALLLFAASLLSAQTTTRSFVLSSDGVNFLEVTRITSEDGFSYSESATLIGPAAALGSDQADKIETLMRELAQSAFRVSQTRKDLNVVANTDSTILAISTVSPLKVIQSRYQADLLTPGWTIENGGAQALVFTVNGQGNLRYSIAGAATKAATVYGAVIRLLNYPANGTNTDFYLSENGSRYFSLPNRAVILKKP